MLFLLISQSLCPRCNGPVLLLRYIRFSGVDTDIVDIVVDVKGEEFK